MGTGHMLEFMSDREVWLAFNSFSRWVDSDDAIRSYYLHVLRRANIITPGMEWQMANQEYENMKGSPPDKELTVRTLGIARAA